MKFTKCFSVLACIVILLNATAVLASNKPVVAIIMDDLGDNYEKAASILSLNPNVTLSILPYTPHAKKIAAEAYKNHFDVMLHMPMEAISQKSPGLGSLKYQMTRSELKAAVLRNLASVPFVSGINNHMGSLLTSQHTQMDWFMETIKEIGDLYFIDSKTHYKSIAFKQAQAAQIPAAQRDIFLDNSVNTFDIDQQFIRLIDLAKKKGFALAIGHPHNETIMAMEYWIPQLTLEGVELVSVSRYVQLTDQRRRLWQASLSR